MILLLALVLTYTLSTSEVPPYQTYIGDLHNHTSYSDGSGTPALAFATAYSNGADFLAVTDHSHVLTPIEWQNTINQANAATIDGEFVALAGYEYGQNLGEGHINVYGTTEVISCTGYNQLADFYLWLKNQPEAIGQFNHPTDNFNLNFYEAEFNGNGNQGMALQEIDSWPVTTYPHQYYNTFLDNGWLVAPTDGDDQHGTAWGSALHTGIVATELTQESVLDALRNRRTFATQHKDLRVVLWANDELMGSVLNDTEAITFTITVDWSAPVTVSLVNNGEVISAANISGEWVVTENEASGYYYAIVTTGVYTAYTAPVWVRKNTYLPLILNGVEGTE